MKLYDLENAYMSIFIGWPDEALGVCQVSDKHIFKWVYMVQYSNWGQLFPYPTSCKRYLKIEQKKKIKFKYSVDLDEIHKTKEFGLKAKVWSLLIACLDNHPSRNKNDLAIKNRALRSKTNLVKSPCASQTWCVPSSSLHCMPEHML